MTLYPHTKWHHLLGAMLEELLTPVGITVYTDFAFMQKPPEADIVLLRREDDQFWTDEQLRRLPDGIRDSRATDILLEFKYTESVNESALLQALGYDTFYKRIQKKSADQLQTFIISSRKPNARFLKKFGFVITTKSGLYTSTNPILKYLSILSLNELTNEEYNAFIKCFASRQTEKRKAFQKVTATPSSQLTKSVYWYFAGLQRVLFTDEGEMMSVQELTPEMVMEVGKNWQEAVFKFTPPAEAMAHYTLADRLAGLQPEERLAGLQPEERLAGLQPEERLAGLQPEERLAGLQPEERLAGLTKEQIETYLKRLQTEKTKKQL